MFLLRTKHYTYLFAFIAIILLFLFIKYPIIIPYSLVLLAFVAIYVYNKLKNKKHFFYVLRKLLIKFQPLFKKDTFILYDNLYEPNAECIDTYCVFEYMQKHNIKSYYVVWKENPFYKKLKYQGKLKNVIVLKNSVYSSFEFFRKIWIYLFRTKSVISSFGGPNREIVEFLYNNKYITYICSDHGSVFFKIFVLSSGYFGPYAYNKFLVCNKYEADLFQKYGWKKENLKIIGLPRWDYLSKKTDKQKTIFVMFTWRTSFYSGNQDRYNIPLESTKYTQRILSFFNNERLKDLLKKHNIKIQVALHHSMLDQTGGRYNFKCDNIELVPSIKISEYIGIADLFITDYSSIFFDFAFLNTPIIFYRPDFDDTSLLELDREDMKHVKSLDNLIYNTVYDENKAIDLIEKYIKNGFVLEDENKQKNNNLFATKENITKKFVNYLQKL